jgi:hypothetical protein
MNIACACGAKYRVPDHLAGRRLRCRKCNGAVEAPAVVAAERTEAAGEDLLTSLAAGMALPQERPAAVVVAETIEESAAAPLRRIGFRDSGEQAAPRTAPRAEGSIAAYLAAVRASFLLPFHFLNLITLGILTLTLSAGRFLPYAGCLGFAGSLVVWGYFAAFMLNAVREDEITQPDLSEGFGSSLLLPAIEYAYAQFIGLLPALIFAGVRIWSGAWGSGRAVGAVTMFSPPAHELAILLALAVAGLLLWPMCLLVVAVSGGMGGVFRPDLIVRTILRTPVAYAVVVACAYSSRAVGGRVAAAAGIRSSEQRRGDGHVPPSGHGLCVRVFHRDAGGGPLLPPLQIALRVVVGIVASDRGTAVAAAIDASPSCLSL